MQILFVRKISDMFIMDRFGCTKNISHQHTHTHMLTQSAKKVFLYGNCLRFVFAL